MEIAVTQTSTFDLSNLSAAHAADHGELPFPLEEDIGNSAFELGLWLSGLDSFLNLRNRSFAEENRSKAASRDWTKEFRLTRSALMLCSKLTFHLGKKLNDRDFLQNLMTNEESAESSKSAAQNLNLTSKNTRELSLVLKDAFLLNESLLRSAPLNFGEWKSWNLFLSEKLKTNQAFNKLVANAEKVGEDSLPEVLRKTLASKPFAEQSDLRLVLPRFAKILKWLSVIGKMLERDEPLKPTLLIFSRIYEQTQEMIAFINNRLLRLADEESELFNTLDGAAYTASIELKKVYSQELTGLIGIRPTPSVYAKIETAYSLLNDSFQQTLVGFARLIEPEIEPRMIFPNFQAKHENSLILRRDLWHILKVVQKAEHHSENHILEDLNRQLYAFLKKSLHYLFYKDKETMERFVEEILITADKKDLIPILHRFGAYLETLFGQVNMRAVLANYPFEPME